MSHILKYTTVDLFLYDLADGIGQTVDKISENRLNFWTKIYKNTLSQQKLEELEKAEKSLLSYIELLGINNNRFEYFFDPLDGYYYPVKLGDTYALQIDCSGKLNDSNWKNLLTLEQLPKLKEIILDRTHNTPATLGKTWLIWGQLTDDRDSQTVAEACYQATNLVNEPNWKQDLKGQGKYQGATLFEIERSDITPDGSNYSLHCLICLFNSNQTKNDILVTIGDLYRDLIQLFHYRHKILWVYEKSRQLKQSLKRTIPTVQTLIDSISDSLTTAQVNLNQLQQNLADALSASHAYQTNLSYLEEQQVNLEINTENYHKRLQAIAQKDPNADLKFLKRFYDFAQDKYINQIKSDIQSLSAGGKPLDNVIATIQGIIEIEKTKNERTLNKTIAIVSAGIGAATLAATTFTKSQEIVTALFPIPEKQPTPVTHYWLSFGLAFFLSVGIGLIAASLTGWFLENRKK